MVTDLDLEEIETLKAILFIGEHGEFWLDKDDYSSFLTTVDEMYPKGEK